MNPPSKDPQTPNLNGIRFGTSKEAPLHGKDVLRGLNPDRIDDSEDHYNRGLRLLLALKVACGFDSALSPWRLGLLPDGRMAVLGANEREYVYAFEEKGVVRHNFLRRVPRYRLAMPLPELTPDEARDELDFLWAGVDYADRIQAVARFKERERRRLTGLDTTIREALDGE